MTYASIWLYSGLLQSIPKDRRRPAWCEQSLIDSFDVHSCKDAWIRQNQTMQVPTNMGLRPFWRQLLISCVVENKVPMSQPEVNPIVIFIMGLFLLYVQHRLAVHTCLYSQSFVYYPSLRFYEYYSLEGAPWHFHFHWYFVWHMRIEKRQAI